MIYLLLLMAYLGQIAITLAILIVIYFDEHHVVRTKKRFILLFSPVLPIFYGFFIGVIEIVKYWKSLD